HGAAMGGPSETFATTPMSAREESNHMEEQIRDLGQTWAAAELRGDAAALGAVLADDFVCVGPLGFVLDKEQYLGSRRSCDLKHEAFAWDDVKVRFYGETPVAVGAQTQKSTRQGREAAGRFRVTRSPLAQERPWRG